MVLVQKWDLFHVFIFGKIGKKKVSVHILERKNAFLDYKNKKQKNWKIGLFPKGLVYGLGPKMGSFSTFLFLAK